MIFFSLLSFYSILSYGPVTTAAISGTAKDSAGAVLPGATVVVQNQDTGVARTLTTDAGGRYSAPDLGLGRYQATASIAGFQSETRSGIVLTVGREAVVDFGQPAGTIFNGSGLRKGNAGQITTIVPSAPAREIQFALKFVF